MKVKKQTSFDLIFGLFLILYLWFILDTGYWSDDRKYEFINGILASNQWSIIQFIWERISVHVEMHGRFFPFTSVFAEGIPFLFGLKLYKIYLMSVTIGCTYLFKAFIRLLTQSVILADLAAILAVVLFSVQKDMPHAVFLCMGGNATISLMLVLASLNFCVLSIRKKILWEGIAEVLSVIFYFLAMMTYEATYPFILLIILLVFYEESSRERKLRKVSPYLIVWIMTLGLYCVLKMFAKESYDGVSVGLSVKNIMRGFAVSVSAPLPFVNGFFRGHAANSFKDFFNQINLLDVLLIVVFIYLLNSIINKRNTSAVSNNKSYFLMIIGIMFVVFPAILMAVSEKYQVLPFGVGYQVIIYQYYGWGCIGSAIILKAWRYFLTKFKHAEKKLIVFDGIIMLITVYLIAVNQQNTRWTIKEMELKEASVSATFDQTLRNAFSNGMIESIPLDAENNLIISSRQYYGMFAKGAMLKELTGQDFQVKWYDELDEIFLEKQPCYALNSGSGWVLVGAITEWDSPTSSAMAGQIWLYCDDEFDRLLVLSRDKLSFLNLKDADEVTHCAVGNIYSINKYYDINQLVPIKHCKYKLGTRFPVSVSRQDIGAYLYGGISDREGGFTWTSDKTMGMYFDLEDADYEKIGVEINVKMIYGERQPVNIHVNGVCVYSEVLSGKSKIEFECIMPQNGILDMHFEFPEARSPKETEESDDVRKLSIAMDDMILVGLSN